MKVSRASTSPGAVETSILKTQESQTCVGGNVLQFLSGWWQRSAAPYGGHAIFSGGPVGTAFPRGVLKCVCGLLLYVGAYGPEGQLAAPAPAVSPIDTGAFF